LGPEISLLAAGSPEFKFLPRELLQLIM